jgi:hypothetical protein
MRGSFDSDPDSTTIFKINTVLHVGAVAEALGESPVHFARVGAARGGLCFEAVKLFENFDRNPDGVFVELKDRLRIVEEDVSVQDIMFGGLTSGTLSFGHTSDLTRTTGGCKGSL